MIAIIFSMLVILAALAAVFLFYPALYGARQPISLARNQDRVSAYEARSKELQQELDNGQLSADEHATLQNELDRQLLLDTDTADRTLEAKGQLNWRWSLVTLLMMVGLAGLVYWPLSQQEAYQLYQQAQVQDRSGTDFDRFVDSLADYVAGQRSPDIETLFALAEARGEQGRYDEAIELLEIVETEFRAIDEYDPDDLSTVLSNRAQFRFMANDRQLNDRIEADFAEALRLDPLNTQALATLGVAYMDAGDYDRAVETWERVLELVPEGSMRQAVSGALDQARRMRGDSVEGAADGVQVLFSALPDDVADDAFVYIVARPVGGSLPVAIQRYTAGELPLALRLTDQDRSADMSPLSGEDNVEVVAFITPPGTTDLSQASHRSAIVPTPTTGDEAAVTLTFEAVN